MAPLQNKSNSDNLENDDLANLLLTAAEIENEEFQKVVPRLREDPIFAREITNIVTPTNTEATRPKSLLENEDLDSSDEEEVKNFLERKYNEYGRDINKKLKQNIEEMRESEVSREVNSSISRSLSETLKKCVTNSKECHKEPSQSFTVTPKPGLVKIIKQEPPAPIYSDPVFGMRLIRPLISGAALKERMVGRTAVSMSIVAFHTERGDLSQDWVIAGVIISKSLVKKTKKGDSFSIWKLSDLKKDIKTISVFLFKSAHHDLYKTSVGLVVAILNPSVLEKRGESSDVACLSIDNPQKVMILGESKDFGMCKSKKKNGEPCTAIVNLTDCEYCVYHVKQEYSKMSRRSELQSTTAGRGLNELRNKVLGKSEVFYGGQSYIAIPAKKSAKQNAKDESRLMTLSEYYQSPNAGLTDHISQQKMLQDVPYANRSGAISKFASTIELNTKQRQKDLDRLKLLKSDSNLVDKSDSQIQPVVPTKYQNREFSFTQNTPTLSQSDFSFDFNLSARNADYSKLKAIETIKKKPLEKSDPNFIKYRGTVQGKKRAIDELHNLMESETKRQKLEENERKSRIQKIIDATSSHTNLIKSRDDEEREKYFNKLEKKEALEEKMLSTYTIPCKAVICFKCKYSSFSAADRCKEECHPIKVIDAEKRFFQCQDCSNRTVTLSKIPKLSCKNCSGSRWKRAPMIRERKICDTGTNLSIRGDEEKFCGNLSSKANLNLLVPDD